VKTVTADITVTTPDNGHNHSTTILKKRLKDYWISTEELIGLRLQWQRRSWITTGWSWAVLFFFVIFVVNGILSVLFLHGLVIWRVLPYINNSNYKCFKCL